MTPGAPLCPASPQLLQMQSSPLSRVALPLSSPSSAPVQGGLPPLWLLPSTREKLLLFQSQGHVLFLRTLSPTPQLPEAATPMPAAVTIYRASYQAPQGTKPCAATVSSS